MSGTERGEGRRSPRGGGSPTLTKKRELSRAYSRPRRSGGRSPATRGRYSFHQQRREQVASQEDADDHHHDIGGGLSYGTAHKGDGHEDESHPPAPRRRRPRRTAAGVHLWSTPEAKRVTTSSSGSSGRISQRRRRASRVHMVLPMRTDRARRALPRYP